MGPHDADYRTPGLRDSEQIQSLYTPPPPRDVQDLAGQTDVHTDDHCAVEALTKCFPAPVKALCIEGC